MRMFKTRHPLKYYFAKLRARARERGIPFGLSFHAYARLARATGYDNPANRGRMPASLSLDRIDPRRGYEDDNIRVISLADNTRRAHCEPADDPGVYSDSAPASSSGLAPW
jgi:hypothetical protein